MRRRVSCAAVLLVVASGVMAGSASAATRFVDDDRVQCPSAPHTTIAAAVEAAGAGDEIRVCPGLYSESVVLPESKPGLRLVSSRRHQAVIRAAELPSTAFTMLGSGALINGFTFRPNAGCAGAAGIYAPGSARILGNRFVKLAGDCDRRYFPISLGSTLYGDGRAATISGNDFRAGTNGGSRPGVSTGYGGAILTRNTFVGYGIVIGENSFARIEQNAISRADVGIAVDNFTNVRAIRGNRLTANRVGLRDDRVFSSFPDPLNGDPRAITGNVFVRNTIAHETFYPSGPTDLRVAGNGYRDNGSLAPRALVVDGVVRRRDGGETLVVDIEASCPAGAAFFLSVSLEQQQPTYNSSSAVLQTDDVTCRGNRRVSYAFELPANGIGPGRLSNMEVGIQHDGGGPRRYRHLTRYRTGVVR